MENPLRSCRILSSCLALAFAGLSVQAVAAQPTTPSPKSPPASTRQLPEDGVEFDQLDKKPVLRVQIPPNYPFEMKRSGFTGQVLVQAVVDQEGRVQDPRVVSSTHREFEKPALDAVLKWRFKPGMKNGRAVSTLVRVPVEFSLR